MNRLATDSDKSVEVVTLLIDGVDRHLKHGAMRTVTKNVDTVDTVIGYVSRIHKLDRFNSSEDHEPIFDIFGGVVVPCPRWAAHARDAVYLNSNDRAPPV